MTSTTILGVHFINGAPTEVVEAGARGGLVVVPSAPVLVDMTTKPALRDALLGADLAITDSGLMVLLWRLLKREKLKRVSGLEYLKLLLEKLQQGAGSREQGAVFWVMPTTAARDQNLAWLRSQGHLTTSDDCYVAPVYPADGELSDGRLLEIIQTRRPAHIILALGGGVQERLGFALKQSLEKAEGVPLSAVANPVSVPAAVWQRKLKAEGSDPSAESTSPAFGFQPSAFGATPLLPAPRQALGRELVESAATPVFVQEPASSSAVSGKYHPGIHCIGAAIGFLSGEQVRIPVWVDFLYLGWLWRSVSAPRRFVPRYWKARRLVWLMIRYGEKAPVEERLRAKC